MKTKTIFIIVSNVHVAVDYPQNVPLPRIGETVVTNDPLLSGIVQDIRHNIMGDTHEIQIVVQSPK